MMAKANVIELSGVRTPESAEAVSLRATADWLESIVALRYMVTRQKATNARESDLESRRLGYNESNPSLEPLRSFERVRW
jgi:hypothetical protein